MAVVPIFAGLHADRVELFGGMRLTRKFIAALVIGVAIVALFQAFFDYRRERDVFDRQMRAEATALGRALARGVAEVWARDGEAAARQFLTTASSKSELIRARWVWLDATTGGDKPHASRDQLGQMAQGYVTVKDENSNVMLTYIPVEVPERQVLFEHHEPAGEKREGGIEIAQNLADLDRFTGDSLRNQVLGSASEVVVAAALALLLGVLFIGRPISRLAAKARRVGTGDLSGPLDLRQRDELGELASEINLMCERLSDERGARESATEQLRHADRLTTVGKLASGIAHELGTPLNVVSGRARLIRDGEVDGKDAVESARIVAEQADRMTALIRQLLDFARPRAPQKAPVNITSLAARVAELVQTIAKKSQITIEPPAHDDKLRVEADDGQLHQVVTNLVVNAIHAMPDGGTVTLRAALVEHTPPPYVERRATSWLELAVQDTGTGMDDETRQRIFEPFFTTKEVGEGTGLGLSVSWGIVREHGGWIDVVSSPGKGSTFTVYLPSAA
jgi:two-component system, NtrC family, sensor kinase